MENLHTVVMILTPMFIGFAFRLRKPWLRMLDKVLTYLVYVILLLIGIGLAQVENLLTQIDGIVGRIVLLFTLLMGCNLLVLCAFDKFVPWRQHATQNLERPRISIAGSLQQLAMVILGYVLGSVLPHTWLPPESAGTYALMLLVFVVGLQLRGNGIALHQILLNPRGLQLSVLFMFSCLLAGGIFAALLDEVSWTKGFALSSGYGWYSLSGIVMTQAYGATWGSIALINDLLREFFALVMIPVLMRRFPSCAVGVGGATSLDFTLPIIQSSGGLAVVPMAISFGFIVNVVSPILMLLFSAMGR